jgi:hypothetical protein
MTAYAPSPIKRARRTKEEMSAIRCSIYELLVDDNPMTVRQVFYRMVSAGVVGKTEAEYKQTVCRLLTEMRLAGEIPFGWIADNTRWQRKPTTYTSMESALRRTAEAYRRSVWDNQGVYVEVWLEKDALAGVLLEETAPWDVPLMVTRGYPSISYLKEAAEMIEYQEKPTYIYYFGDHDPSGRDIPRNVEERLREFAPGAELQFDTVAVTPEQIERLDLPTRPTKKSDSRSKGFEGESVEVDAIPPRTLRQIARQCITGHVDDGAYEQMMAAEREEREVLTTIAGAYGGDR